MPVILLPCSLIPQRGFGGKILCPPLRAAARVRFAGCFASLRNRPCTRAHCGRRIFLPPPLPPGGAARGCPCRPCGPLPAALPPLLRRWAAAPGLFSSFNVGGVYGWFRFCLGFLSRRWRCRPAVVLRLGVGSPGLAWWRGLVAGSGLPVRAVRLIRPGGRFRARRFGAGVAGVAAARRCRLCGLVRLRPAGPGFRGQGRAAFRPFLPGRLRGSAANARALFSGGSRCLACRAWSRWPVRGRCLRPAPPWWSGWHRVWPAPALRSRSAAAPVPMRRYWRPCPDPCRRPWCIASPPSVLPAKAPARFRRPRACRPSRPRAAASIGGRAARLRSRCAPGWPAARGQWSMQPMPAWRRSSARPARPDRSWRAAARFRAGCRWWRFRSVFPVQIYRFWGRAPGCLAAPSEAMSGRKNRKIFSLRQLIIDTCFPLGSGCINGRKRGQLFRFRWPAGLINWQAKNRRGIPEYRHSFL
ncbi:hypothetical protein Metal_4005 (plasmid) [Methylomicrobium album BG8]|uniref:Uncharacterized protein n=1 Tax=Methylomicrobium album BG8 TaxID=686340 RepID=H8GRJ4_METAL|nr:hypothetical protein Metal_4005 [Methylomicrobium album BG8]